LSGSATGLSINPQTAQIDGLPAGGMTADEFARLVPPSCPVCGAQVVVDRVDITWDAEEEARLGRQYIAGRWECPHGCNPLTGQRRHYGQSYRTGKGFEGTECTCTCGDVTIILTKAEADAWQEVHKR
jgi:hypothetical protein